MKRADLLFCADCSGPRFNLLASRDQLPFLSRDDETRGKHMPYFLRHALLLRLTLDLIGADVRQNPLLTGVPASTAAKIMSNVSMWAKDELDNPHRDFWVGQLVIREETDEADPLEYNAWFHGSSSDLPDFMARECQTDEGTRTVVRVNIVNVARAVSFVRSRAEQLKLTDAQLYGWGDK